MTKMKGHDYQKNTTPELERFLMYGIKDIEHFIEAIKSEL